MKSNPKVKITLDGKEIEAEAGKPLLQACLDAGREVPHFCYHPGIGVEGSCRLCLVEIAGMPKLATSCTVPVKAGMVVSTASEPVKKARKGVLEFFLLNHPLDCPICDKGGECPLQNYSLDSGQGESRMEFTKIQKEKHRVIGEHIILDKERCVLCDRCVRYLRDFTGREELQIRNRGASSEIFIPEGTALTSGLTGNLADICPVGALLSREFRFRARPWEMKTVNTVCGECSLGCAAQVWRKGNEPLRLTPRIEPAVNEWWLCDKGRFSLSRWMTADRVRGSGSAAEMAASMATEIRKVPKGALAIVAEPNLTNEEFLQLKRLARLAGGGRIFIPTTEAIRNTMNAIHSAEIEAEFPDSLEEANAAVILGGRLEAEHPVLVLRLRRLHHAVQMPIFTAGSEALGFDDIAAGTVRLTDEESIAGFLRAWTKTGSHEEFLRKLSADASLAIFLSDHWMTSSTQAALSEWIRAAAERSPRRLTIAPLLSGANIRGMLDQWDESVRPLGDLETEIQRGRVEGLIWFGAAPTVGVFNEYARGMRAFVQFVLKPADAHPRAKNILPLDTFLEKDGTYTNSFGRVQIVRRSTRVVENGFAVTEMLDGIARAMGEKSATREELYGELADQLTKYPRTSKDIPESTMTYAHYERALWR